MYFILRLSVIVMFSRTVLDMFFHANRRIANGQGASLGCI
jgi:hypothetical protein